MENTVNITAADGKAEATILVGNDYRILEDHTTETFHTDSLPDFIKYTKACDEICGGYYEIFYNTKDVVLRPWVEDSRYLVPAATCKITPSPLVMFVEGALNRPMSIAEFEAFLFIIRPYMNDALKTLYSYVRNFKITKLTEVRRTVDNKGNYEYVIKREKGGQEEVEIPETITLVLPPIEGATEEDKQVFVIDLLFDWKDTDDGVSANFKLAAPLWGTMKDDAIKAVIQKYLKELPHAAYWGRIQTIYQDDSWKYMINSPQENSVQNTNSAVNRGGERPF
jgi:hypothetical protein